jgi:hypothetical protein
MVPALYMALSSYGTYFVVSTEGSDSNAGTFALSFTSIERAVDQADMGDRAVKYM